MTTKLKKNNMDKLGIVVSYYCVTKGKPEA